MHKFTKLTLYQFRDSQVFNLDAQSFSCEKPWLNKLICANFRLLHTCIRKKELLICEQEKTHFSCNHKLSFYKVNRLTHWLVVFYLQVKKRKSEETYRHCSQWKAKGKEIIPGSKIIPIIRIVEGLSAGVSIWTPTKGKIPWLFLKSFVLLECR